MDAKSAKAYLASITRSPLASKRKLESLLSDMLAAEGNISKATARRLLSEAQQQLDEDGDDYSDIDVYNLALDMSYHI